MGEKLIKGTQKAINKLLSEEWAASEMYKGMVVACDAEDRQKILKIFASNAEDEYDDHFKKILRFALMNDFTAPFKPSDYEKYADENAYKLLTNIKKEQKAEKYIESAIESEVLAVESYAKVLEDDDVCEEFKILCREIIVDEQQHLSDLQTLMIACNYGAILSL